MNYCIPDYYMQLLYSCAKEQKFYKTTSKTWPSKSRPTVLSIKEFFFFPSGASLVAQTVKRLSAMQDSRVRSLGWEDPLEMEMAALSSILAWKIPWTVGPGRLPSTGSQRVRHDWARPPPPARLDKKKGANERITKSEMKEWSSLLTLFTLKEY